MDSEILKMLKACSSTGQMLDVIIDNYDLSKPLGVATKGVLIAGLDKVLTMVDAKLFE